jgi:hypothetical protein
VTGATGPPWVPGSGVGRRPHGGRGPDALPTAYLLLCVCITSSALVVRTLGLVHLRTGSSDLGYLSRRSVTKSSYCIALHQLWCSVISTRMLPASVLKPVERGQWRGRDTPSWCRRIRLIQ